MPTEAIESDSLLRALRRATNAKTMSSNPKDPDELREEYDFSQGEVGRYADRLAKGSNVVILDPDVAAEFPDNKAVNKALRAYLASKKSDKGAA